MTMTLVDNLDCGSLFGGVCAPCVGSQVGWYSLEVVVLLPERVFVPFLFGFALINRTILFFFINDMSQSFCLRFKKSFSTMFFLH